MPRQIPGQPTIAKMLTEVSGTDYEDGAGVLYIGVTGDLIVDLIGVGSTEITYSNVPVGFFPPIVKKIYSGSTATGLVMHEGLISKQ